MLEVPHRAHRRLFTGPLAAAVARRVGIRDRHLPPGALPPLAQGADRDRSGCQAAEQVQLALTGSAYGRTSPSRRSRKSAAARYAWSQLAWRRKLWTSSGNTSCSTGTFCFRSASARSTLSLNGTFRSSSPWISRTGERQVLTNAIGDDSNARREMSWRTAGS